MHLPVITHSKGELADAFSRRVTYLRVSLTDRCNYRCTYCMPQDRSDLLPRDEILSFEELEQIVRVFASVGVRRVRLTGGEPTVRRDVIKCVERLARIPGIEDVVMTTNGHRLVELAEDLARAGLTGMNISVDTLDPARFRAITRRGDLGSVVAGIKASMDAGIRPLKINVVALKGFNDDEVGTLCDFSWARGIVPRFIEWMPMSDGSLFAPGSLLTAAEIRALVQAHVGRPLEEDAPVAARVVVGPARYWRVKGEPHRKVGIISAMSEHFCDTCNRVRLSATGRLHTCLAHDDDVDLRRIVRGPMAGETKDAAILAAIRGALMGKRMGHEFSTTGCGGPRKHMVTIGG